MRTEYRAVLADGRIRWKSTRTRSKQEAAKSLSHLEELLRPRARVKLLSRFIEEFLSYAFGTYSAKTMSMYKSALGTLKAFVNVDATIRIVDIPLR